MKKIFLILIFIYPLFSCEDVIDVDLNESEPRLVIEASINWFKGTQGNEQSIKLSLSAPFFEENVPPASGAVVQVFDLNNNTFDFIEEGNTGIYRNDNFIPTLDAIYTLNVLYNNELYTASENFKSVVPIEFIEQTNDGGFSGEDIELKAFYTDPASVKNYYFFEFLSDISVVPNLEVYEDRFTDGNQIFGYYTEEDLEPGDVVTIRNYGISERFYEYMFILLQQGTEENGGPFETQPATVRGNCINQSNPDNFPFGYFRLSEVDELVYTVQ
ncbi:DUF4249 family protein [Winogradskyella sp. KYW1333]|uniref:DUF4249 family protein n=1 Tax=Winogradskyella sp. KYW1333 TaxID=2282123 RepID=UPI000DF21AAD|nr:DUF4249 family protein [Winogradskyella sp. KYW1333]RCT54480.1 DUF4249 domain-containing protein [Winogradskyella sp. KYW1333]